MWSIMKKMRKFLIPAIVLILLISNLMQITLAASLAHNSTNSSNNNNNNAHQRKFHLKIHRSGTIDIPGLYDDHANIIIPIQGRNQFHKLIFGQNSLNEINNRENSTNLNCDKRVLQQMAQNQTISLVQFYMATCPDCQGFSPYFKRFAADISPHWRSLVQIYTVNCNDFENIHLCQEENPKLIVPMVRWYAMPLLQANSRAAASCKVNLNFSKSLLNVAHRKFIEKQRRDMISLRRATIKYIDSIMDELREKNSNSSSTETLFNWLPIRWHLIKQLTLGERVQNNQTIEVFFNKLFERQERLLLDLNATSPLPSSATNKFKKVKNVIVFENQPSKYSMGRIAVADWANWTMASLVDKTAKTSLLLVHWTSDFSILKQLIEKRILKDNSFPSELSSNKKNFNFNLHKSSPIAIVFTSEYSSGSYQLRKEANFLVANISGVSLRHRRHAQQRLGRINQRASLERFYSRNQASLPYRYALTMSSNEKNGKLLRRKRMLSNNNSIELQQIEAEHINWAPELLWPQVELMRYKLNEAIANQLIETDDNLIDWPGKQFLGNNQGELDNKKRKTNNNNNLEPIEARDDDLTLMLLTDYYKVLDEIVHLDLIAKGEIDGYQLLSSTCFLNSLKSYFPFQGNAQVPESIFGYKSIARYYLHLIQQRWFNELVNKVQQQQTLNNDYNSTQAKATLLKLTSSSKMMCPENVRQIEGQLNRMNLSLANVSLSVRQLENYQADVRKQANVGLAQSNKLTWKYCAGSEANLRGHTCSLWILFHTLTVEEYLERKADNYNDKNKLTSSSSSSSNDQLEYKYQIDYNRLPSREQLGATATSKSNNSCDPKNPERAYLASSSSELFIANSTGSNVLATIINFVRFYLPCTGCAAHFSCMVEHSPGLKFKHFNDNNNDDERVATDDDYDSHLLWLWEGHNRVNLRTRGTHSEDSMRPKHVFPVYEACPRCYLERPPGNNNISLTLEELKFNRRELVQFLVARYRKSAILNNKINIEDLYKG